jgi:hypothetical protein
MKMRKNNSLKIVLFIAVLPLLILGFLENLIRAICVQLLIGVWRSAFNKTKRTVQKYLAELPEWVRLKIPFWDYYGYRHNSEYLAMKSTKEYLLNKPLEFQANYCDRFFYEMCTGKAEINKNFIAAGHSKSHQDFATDILIGSPKTATDIGNLAMILLAHKKNGFYLDMSIYRAAAAILWPKTTKEPRVKPPSPGRIPEDGC